MDSIKKLLKVGHGPSSSHTMGPQKAAEIFKNKNITAERFEVELYGSLASTGRGHLTDVVIKETLKNVKIYFRPSKVYKYHSNGMLFKAFVGDECIDEWLVFSVGGGELREEGEPRDLDIDQVYKHKYIKDIIVYCEQKKINLYEYIVEAEGPDIFSFGKEILKVMFSSVQLGIRTKGVLPGKLKIKRRASSFYERYQTNKNYTTLEFAGALAVSEVNASGGLVVTAPTCGASGVMPGVLYAYCNHHKYPKRRIIEALLVGGLIGNIVKTTGSISGAEVGCQGEVGTACAMAAAAITYLLKGTNKQIEYASEIAFEHHLGLTCDPIQGYVQIPCIERNAMSCKRAIDCANFALQTDGEHYIGLDEAIKVMLKTGKDLKRIYRETSKGGLAKEESNRRKNERK